MTYITCPHCGDTYPNFDVAHVCSSGPYALRYYDPKIAESVTKTGQEVLKRLISKVDRINDFYTVGPVQRAAMEDFADLIVQECADLATKEYDNRSAIHGNDLIAHFNLKIN